MKKLINKPEDVVVEELTGRRPGTSRPGEGLL